MAFPRLFQKLFQNDGASSMLRTDIIPVDSALSATSINAVQNKIVKSALDTKLNLSGGSITGNLSVGGTFTVSCKRFAEYDTGTLYLRPSLFTSAKRSVTISAHTVVAIGNSIYESTANQTISISDFGDVAGGDFYIYACAPSSGTSPTFVVSRNSTVPTGYTANNSRKIGGFHTLCANVGTLTNKNPITGADDAHWLSGYVKGDILPASCWDLLHRPKGEPEGYVYAGSVGKDIWVSIYLLSWDGTKLVSKFGGATADGVSAKKWHGELFNECLARQNQRLPWRDEFALFAKGSNEQTNIKGSTDATTTGGHVDTASRRMVSNLGCEDCCGFLWQWTANLGFFGGSSWTDSTYTSPVDPRSYGQTYGTLYRLGAGGTWDSGTSGGSRSARCDRSSAYVASPYGGHGASEPLHVNALTRTDYPFK